MGHIIHNFDALAVSDQRKNALLIAEAGYDAIDVGKALAHKLRIDNGELRVEERPYQLSGRRIFFVGIGKCAFVAAAAIEKLLGDMLTAGIALGVSSSEEFGLKKVEALAGTHPLPSEQNENATRKIFEMLSKLSKDDLVIFLVSGGGSTLICSYEAPMTYADEAALFKDLTAHGATIQEMNTVRKHTSRARGGGLARAAYPAEVVSLIVSDVPGNDIAFISSAPTVKDSSTIEDAEAVLAKYGVTPAAGVTFIESPKDEKFFGRVTNILFLTGRDALMAMMDAAAEQGYLAEIADDHFAGEARDIARKVIGKLRATAPKTALLYAGESTVTLGATRGAGGRSQEMALAALGAVSPDELILPFSSDGRDNTDAAGAIGDNISRMHATAYNLSPEEYLDAHRSYDFFSATGDALMTGYTGSNVSDLIIALKN